MITSASFFASMVGTSATMLRVRRNGMGPPPFSRNDPTRQGTVHGMDHLYRARSLHAMLARPNAGACDEAEHRTVSDDAYGQPAPTGRPHPDDVCQGGGRAG